MRKIPAARKGTVETLWWESRLLAGNLLAEPTNRRVDVWRPHGSDGTGLPLLVDLVGFTAGGPAHTNWKNFEENVPERLDRLVGTGAMPPVVVAFPDCFTRLGGNQYINSSATGPWADILTTEVVPLVEGRFGCGGTGRRGVFGKSSGGYGAIMHAMLYADTWAAAACHSGDMAFELCYLPQMPRLLRAIAKQGGTITGFIGAFESAAKTNETDLHDLMHLAMAATYDPDPSLPFGIRLPVTDDTCEVIPERWAQWLAHDPVLIADRHADALRGLKGLYIDCGIDDQFDLLYGARRLHRSLVRLGVPHRYAEFPDNHSSVDYRMDDSLPFLAGALTA
jgi:enterochelin esterase-like enzyme